MALASAHRAFAPPKDATFDCRNRPVMVTRAGASLLTNNFLDVAGSNVIGFVHAPKDNETLRIYSSIRRDDLGRSAEPIREAVDDLALRSRYEGLTLDVSTGAHTRADRTTIELRRILADLIEGAPSRV